MPLLDHFHPPLIERRSWERFHGVWAAVIAGTLNQRLLPRHYFAEMEVTIGTHIEVDVGTFTEHAGLPADEVEPHSNGSAVAVQTQVWAPPVPVLVVPAVFPDEFELLIYNERDGRRLVAAIELVSPANKDREETRRAFATKCSAYLQHGVGVIIVDVVTSRLANLHDELGRLLGYPASFAFPTPTSIYATAYRPVHREKRNEMDVWREPLAVGQPLPTLPLAVLGLGYLPVDLEATYTETRRLSRID